jgi:UPF0755 protein
MNFGISRKKKILIFTFLTSIILLGGAIFWYLYSPIETKRNIKLNSSLPTDVIESLTKQGYSVGLIDKIYMEFIARPIEGYIYINKRKIRRYQFLNALSRKSTHYVPITIIPGETSYFVLQDIAKKLNFDLVKLAKIYRKTAPFKEGNFLAETYNIPLYFDEKKTVKFILRYSFKSFKKLFKKYNIEYTKEKLKNYLIIASIIQKEAGNKKEMPLISSVIYNRLKRGMRLQMDGSLNYGRYSHTKVTPERIKSDKSYYNTYKHKGIPKEPICNISILALESAIAPAKTDYLYFFKRDNNSHIFTSKYKEHIKNIRDKKSSK